MRTSDADRHYGNRAAVSRALAISTAATSKWGDVVPFGSASRLQELTNGALQVDRSLYDDRLRPRPVPDASRPARRRRQGTGRAASQRAR